MRGLQMPPNPVAYSKACCRGDEPPGTPSLVSETSGESLHKEQERIRTEALRAINADAALKDHLNMVEASLDTIHAFTIKHERPTEDELTIQRLGMRLFNAEAS
jgi:hypothetical protein